MYDVIAFKGGGHKISSMISDHWFRSWLGAVRNKPLHEPKVTLCGLVMTLDILVNTGSDNGLLPEGTKPLS